MRLRWRLMWLGPEPSRRPRTTSTSASSLSPLFVVGCGDFHGGWGARVWEEGAEERQALGS